MDRLRRVKISLREEAVINSLWTLIRYHLFQKLVPQYQPTLYANSPAPMNT